MTARIGLGIGGDAVRAVLLENGRETWRAERTVGTGPGALRETLGVLLGSAPRRRFARYDVVAAVGPSLATFKRVEGYGADADAETLGAAIAANVARFLVQRSAEPTMLLPVRRQGDGWWCGIVSLNVAEAVRDACRARRLRLRGLVPTVTVLAHGGLVSGTRWHDAGVVVEVHHLTGAVTGVLPVRASDHASSAADAPHADGFADALGAARIPLASSTALDPWATTREARQRIALRATAIGATLVSLLAAATAPDLVLLAGGERKGAHIDSLRALAMRPEGQLRAMRQDIAAGDSVTAFAASGRSTLGLLARIAAALPEASAIVALRIDARGASVVALTPPGAAVLPALSRLDGIASAQLVGAVTRETIQGRAVQRVAIVLAFASADHRARTMPGATR